MPCFPAPRSPGGWRLSHLAQTIHYLMRAILLSLASVGFGLAWLFCSLDRFRSSKGTTAWLIFPNSSPESAPERPSPAEFEERHQSCTADRPQHQPQPRTIDSLIRNRGVRV